MGVYLDFFGHWGVLLVQGLILPLVILGSGKLLFRFWRKSRRTSSKGSMTESRWCVTPIPKRDTNPSTEKAANIWRG